MRNLPTYPNHGRNCYATYEDAIDAAIRRGIICRILECPHDDCYDTGYHIIVSSYEHYHARGWICRGMTVLISQPILTDEERQEHEL